MRTHVPVCSRRAGRGSPDRREVLAGSARAAHDGGVSLCRQPWARRRAAEPCARPVTDFIDLVLPELRRRGLFRTYEGRTLRENLGLPRPENRFARRAAGAA
ncbi:hypothetical protein BE20_39060 [Sorangium cellulosum]|nr:hypothetical protein BE20_39060 [Sorangium cellulosum]